MLLLYRKQENQVIDRTAIIVRSLLLDSTRSRGLFSGTCSRLPVAQVYPEFPDVPARTALIVFSCLILFACATVQTERAERDVAATVGAWASAVRAQDLPGVMATIGPEFHHAEWGNRDGAEAFMRQAIEMGYLDGVEIAFEDSTTTIAGDTATVSPVGMVGSFGRLMAQIDLTRHRRDWLIVGMQFSDE